ncbi:MAG: branched-chain amino acid ABC transporter permease [Anaerolineae bacterium]
MSADQTAPAATQEPGESGVPHIGADEWVSQIDRRLRRRSGVWGAIADRWEAIPFVGRAALVALVLLLAPVVTGTEPALNLLRISNNDFIIRVGASFLAFSILAIGLNVVVGYAGLLDLGYVAFFGVAGYAYAYLSSDFIGDGVHVPSIISVPLIIAFTALLGWLLGSASIRLRGDYLAIVTLGFGQLFVQLTTTLTRVELPGLARPVDLTRGPNGINNLDPIMLFGYEFKSTLQYYFLFFILLALIFVVVDRLNRSRIGRAWRAMREDELATEVMGMPTRRLKLMAFAIGAAIAALTGSVYAAWQGNVVPNRYDLTLLIELYAMMVLGGLGSLPGVILGALIFTTLPELLRNVELAGFLFYIGGLIGLIGWLRLTRRLAAVLGVTLAGGLLLKLAVNWLWPGLDTGMPPAQGSLLNQLAQGWLVIPENFKGIGNLVMGGALLTLLLTLLIKKPWRWIILGLSLYMFAFAWETRLATEPSVTRILVVGATLIVLMITRPQGLLGKLRVSVI